MPVMIDAEFRERQAQRFAEQIMAIVAPYVADKEACRKKLYEVGFMSRCIVAEWNETNAGPN